MGLNACRSDCGRDFDEQSLEDDNSDDSAWELESEQGNRAVDSGAAVVGSRVDLFAYCENACRRDGVRLGVLLLAYKVYCCPSPRAGVCCWCKDAIVKD